MKSIFKTLFGKKEVTKKSDKLYFIETGKIIKKEDNKSGFISNIETENDSHFLEIDLIEQPEIVSMKRGVARVVQDMKLSFGNPGFILSVLENIKERKKNISVLHIDTKDNCYLYGENIGLEIVELTENTVLLEGEEADIFYRVDFELAQKLISESVSS